MIRKMYWHRLSAISDNLEMLESIAILNKNQVFVKSYFTPEKCIFQYVDTYINRKYISPHFNVKMLEW